MLYVDANINPAQALQQLNIGPYRAAIIMHVGASEMAPTYMQKLAALFTNGIARFANDHLVLVADGGTESGGMKLMGEARRAVNGKFPLLGVAVSGKVTYPGGPPPAEDRWPLNQNHSHFLLVKADEFGAESPLLVGLATACEVPALAIIVNGGQLVKQEAAMHLQHNTPLITLKGSGRYADELAKQPHPQVTVFDSNQASAQALYTLLGDLLFAAESRR